MSSATGALPAAPTSTIRPTRPSPRCAHAGTRAARRPERADRREAERGGAACTASPPKAAGAPPGPAAAPYICARQSPRRSTRTSAPTNHRTIEPAAPRPRRSRPEHGGSGVGAGLTHVQACRIYAGLPKGRRGAAGRRAHRGLVIRSSSPPVLRLHPLWSTAVGAGRATSGRHGLHATITHQRSGAASCCRHSCTGRLRSGAAAATGKMASSVQNGFERAGVLRLALRT